MMTAFYNEIDPKAAAWLRELIKAGLIADGVVDERSIEDIRPEDIVSFTQCHFFAGIGGWSVALRLAGWPDDRPIWTGSCPCQSFSAAGKGKGFADERHLWPAWFHLIQECKPAIVFGEQVDAAIRHGWLDLVQTDLEAIGYAFGSAVIPAAGIGAPHGRHRAWFVGESNSSGRESRIEIAQATRQRHSAIATSTVCSVEHSSGTGLQGRSGMPERTDQRTARPTGTDGSVGDTNMPEQIWDQQIHVECEGESNAMVNAEGEQERISRFARESRKTAGFWNDADWIPCSDEKWRPIEPGIFPLANGVSSRMDLLRGFGNAIVPQVAAQFISAYLEVTQPSPASP